MSTAENHPIQLVDVVFTRVHVEAVAKHSPPDPPELGNISNQLTVEKPKEPGGQYQAVMRTVINKEGNTDHPYIIDIECHAILTADATLTPQEAHRGVTITAHSVLYGAIRETMAWLTGRQPYGPVVIGLSVLAKQQKETPKA